MYLIRIGGAFICLLTSLTLFNCLMWWKQGPIYGIPKNLRKYVMYDELPAPISGEIDTLKLIIKEINKKREVKNWKKFGPVIKETTTIVVQVHRDIIRLQYCIISLAQVRYVESILLVFSHSFYDKHINRLIQSIDFCKVMQIFYPHSVQMHPNDFPGIDPEDCINGSQTTSQKCQQRDARSIERKHHWWWKASFIFDRLQWSLIYTGTVIFLEEDQFAAPDLLYMLQYVKRALSYFPHVEIMSFGKIYTKNLDHHLLSLEYWRPPFDVGIAFNKTTWNKIIELSSFYCMYDDCSWSYSLLNVFRNFPNGDVAMVACGAPRVISTKQFENADRANLEVPRVFSNSHLFPEKVETGFLYGPNGVVYVDTRPPTRGSGGWTNVKDHLLCLDPLAEEYYEGTTMTSRFDQYTN